MSLILEVFVIFAAAKAAGELCVRVGLPAIVGELLVGVALGPHALGDLRRNNGTRPSVLTPELLDKLKKRVGEAPPDGGLWTSGKVATWMAAQLGLEKLAPQRGWEALQAIGWSIQSPRPRHPNSATPEQEAAFKKSSLTRSPKKPRSIPTSRSKYGRRMSIASA